jgi:hypothetical protein
MGNILRTEQEEKEKKAKAILNIKYALLPVGSVAYWEALGDKEEVL